MIIILSIDFFNLVGDLDGLSSFFIILFIFFFFDIIIRLFSEKQLILNSFDKVVKFTCTIDRLGKPFNGGSSTHDEFPLFLTFSNLFGRLLCKIGVETELSDYHDYRILLSYMEC